jgi:hypothetical protein
MDSQGSRIWTNPQSGYSPSYWSVTLRRYEYSALTPSMRRPIGLKSVFLLPASGFLVFEPGRLYRHPSIRTLC